jgi:hypothetical protein
MHVHDFMENNGEAIMHDMINTSREDGEGDYTQVEPEPNQHAYDIGAEPLFPNSGISMEEGLTAAALAGSLSSSFADAKRTSQRTASYTPTKDRVLCQAWMEISTDPICGAKQKGSTIGGRWENSSMSKGRCVRNHSKAIGVTYPFPRDGAPSMPSVASFKSRLRRSKKGKLAGSWRLTWYNL